MRRGHLRTGGFTLIEIAVALALLGAAVVILLESHYGSMSLFAAAQEEAIAELVVSEAVANAEREVLSGKTDGEGELGAALEGYSYTFSAKLQDEVETPGLYAVTVTVAGPGLDRTLEYLVYHGAQTDAGQ
jgi:prepilin-type N-terminal cleavage/methylation domain-containing protein